MNLRGQKLLIASGNAGKLDEFRALLAPYGTEVLSLKDLGLGEPEETEVSFAGNARLKARAACKASGLPALADDSGLSVAALGGAPGIYTADWAERSAGRDFDHAMGKTWGLLQGVGGRPPWVAAFHCVLALVWPDGRDMVFHGQLTGQIVWPRRGLLGHGYDPIFQPDGHLVTMGEMTAEEKNQISHRADAVRKFTAACFT
jgi:XTP/dITP diphosphohydrolase